jgi:antitoxin YefM
MDKLNYINGATVSATDVRKSWTKIVKGVQTSHKPIYVFTNNTPEAVVLSYEDFQAMQTELELARRELFGRQMIADLIDIAELENDPIAHMQADESAVFHEAKGH